MSVSPERFVEVWQRADSVEDAARQLGVTEGAARARASAYRKRGIPLVRKYRRGPVASLDIAALAKLAQKHAPKGGAS